MHLAVTNDVLEMYKNAYLKINTNLAMHCLLTPISVYYEVRTANLIYKKAHN